MDDEPDYPPDPALDTLMALIAELHRTELFHGGNLASIARRLELAGHADLAARTQMIPLSNALDDPEETRAGLHLVTAVTERADQS